MAVIRPSAVNDGDVFNVLQALVNRVLGNPLLAAASDATDVKTTNAVYFSIAGVLYTKAATDGLGDMGAYAIIDTGAGEYCKVRVEIDVNGAVSFKRGPVAASQAQAVVPRRTASKATLGWIEIPPSYVFGTSNFTDAGVTLYSGDPDLGDGHGIPPNDRGIDQTALTS
jgi:hypothetical protein